MATSNAGSAVADDNMQEESPVEGNGVREPTISPSDGRQSDDNDDDESQAESDNDDDDDDDNEGSNAEDENDGEDDASEEEGDNNSEDNDSEKEEEEADDDSESDGDSDSEGDDSNDDNDDDDDDQGISAYEKRRLENIKRNQARLAQLGLQGSGDGGGVLGKKKKSKSHQKRRTSVGSDVNLEPTRKSRRSTGNVNYVEPSLRTILDIEKAAKEGTELPAEKKREEARKKKRKKEKPKESRMARFVYDEFQFINTHKRRMLKDAEKNVRSAETEIKYWAKKAEREQKKIDREKEQERAQKQIEEERKIFGTSAKDFLLQIERRVPEVMSKVRTYDNSRVSTEQKVEVAARALENENKLKLLDALYNYPKAMKDAVRTLNSLLVERAPKDPPPPRRSKRNGEDDEPHADEPKAKKRKTQKKEAPPEIDTAASESAAISNAVTQASWSQTEAGLRSKELNESPQSKGPDDAKKKKKRELNVGQWISPSFCQNITKNWLEIDAPSKHFQLASYVPQPGDTVLYYPAGHREYTDRFRDHLARGKISRSTLWDRAEKEKRKEARDAAEGKADDADSENANATPSKKWWNDEWLSGVESTFGSYPLLCRVERTQAEFPPDPTKMIPDEDGKVWKETKPQPKTTNKKEVMRLSVTLRPLTPLLPPSWTSTGPIDKTQLSLPPNFTVVTFPTALQPFLVPFSWAYVRNHLLAADDAVTMQESKRVESKAKVKDFLTLADGDEFGSFRLDDKASFFTQVFQQSPEQDASNGTILEGAKGKARSTTTIPPQDTVVIAQFLAKVLGITHNVHHDANLSESPDFWNLVRSTLPLWNGVSYLKDIYDRKTYFAHSWDMQTSGSKRNQSLVQQGGIKELLQFGLPSPLNDALRLKIDCTIDSYLDEHPEAEVFTWPVTEDFAQYYYCAVPVGYYFNRILDRLKPHGNANGMCFYRSFEAVLQDLDAIQDNCGLYNTPDSQVVATVNEYIPAIKKLLSDVVSSHVQEQKDKVMAENEKKRFLASALSSDACIDESKETQKALNKSVDPFRVPFKGELYRDWVQSTGPDQSWKQGASIHNGGLSQWLPQTGDSVLYSRDLHVRFVDGHYDELEANQRHLPRFKRHNEDSSPEADASESQGRDEGEGQADEHEVSSSWMPASIVSIRAEFPPPRQARSKQDSDVKDGFATQAPILAIKLQLGGGAGTVTVFWRPCEFQHHDKGVEGHLSECCTSCGVQVATSFLCPSWGDQFGKQLQLEELQDKLVMVSPGTPKGMKEEEAICVERSLDMLKRRCLDNVRADYLDPNLTNDKVKHGYVPRVVKSEHKPLPMIDLADDGSGLDPTHTKLSKESTMALLDTNFVPPWLSFDASGEKTALGSLEASLSPVPKLSLELICWRLKNGFYRQKEALANDIMESYVTSVLLCLAPVAKKKKNPISIKKITSVLSSRRYNLASSDGKTHVKKTSKKEAALEGPANGKKADGKSNGSKKVSKKEAAPESAANGKKSKTGPIKAAKGAKVDVKAAERAGSTPTKKKPSTKTASVQLKTNGLKSEEKTAQKGTAPKAKKEKVLSEEESALVSRLEKVRLFYATALVCVSEATHVGNLFGITPLKVSRQQLRQKSNVFSIESVEAARARRDLLQLSDALKRDMCDNRYPLLPVSRPKMKIKFTVAGKAVERDKTRALPAIAEAAAAGKSETSKPSSSQSDPPKVESSTNPVAKPLSEETGSNKDAEAKPPADKGKGSSKGGDSEVLDRDGVKFSNGDYVDNLPLQQLFYGRDKRMNPCARCQVTKRSLVYCRVNKAHSNADFDLMGCFRDNGGLDGLSQTLLQMPQLSVEASAGEITSGVPSSSGEPPANEMAGNTAGASKSDEPQGLADEANPESQVCQAVAETVQSEEPPQKKNDETKHASAENQPKAEDEEKDKQDQQEKVSHREMYQKALECAAEAKELLKLAKAYKEAPHRLSHEFMEENFPFDPTDNKYTLCVICGLDGEMLCCETEGCPAVIHVRCSTMEQVPEGAWFCDDCKAKKGRGEASNMDVPSSGENRSKTGDEAPGATDKLGSSDATSTIEVSADNAEQEIPASGQDEAGSNDNETGMGMVVASAEEPTPDKESATEPAVASLAQSKPEENTIVPAFVSTMPPIVTFDEAKMMRLQAELDHLFLVRTGHPRGKNEGGKKKSKGANDDENENKNDAVEPEQEPADDEEQFSCAFAVGTKFRKKFRYYGTFNGEVTELPTSENQFYRVRYEDGDEEELSEAQLLRLKGEKAKKKKKGKQANTATVTKENGTPEAATKKEGGAKKRGRPSKVVDNTPSKKVSSSKKAAVQVKAKEPSIASEDESEEESNSEVVDAFSSLSAMTQSFLSSQGISTAKDFLESRTTDLSTALVEWRAKNDMPVLKGRGEIASVSSWKAKVRDAEAARKKKGGAKTRARQSKAVQNTPSRKVSPSKKTAAQSKRKAPTIASREESEEESSSEVEDPISCLSAITLSFLESQGITTAKALLETRTTDLSPAFVEWRAKKDMPVLKGRGEIASVSGWKGQVRQVAKERLKHFPDLAEFVPGGLKPEPQPDEADEEPDGNSPRKRRRREPDRFVDKFLR